MAHSKSWKRLREEQLDAHPLCKLCQFKSITTAAVEVDHILPKSLGGVDEPSNLQSLCRSCHEHKTARENSYKIQVEEDGFPRGDYRRQILARRERHSKSIRKISKYYQKYL